MTIKKSVVFISIVLLFTCMILVPESQGQSNEESGWQVLFNGENLNGWQLHNRQHEVEVKDGMIIGICKPGVANGFVVTEKQYDDFILEAEVKTDLLTNNSGIQFRSLFHKTFEHPLFGTLENRLYGYQAEVDVTPQRWSGGIYDEARRGWLYILEDDNSPAKNAYKNNQWNKYRIEAIGNSIRIWVNGIPTSHLIDNETSRGYIALQLHGNTRSYMPSVSQKVYFRNIRIKTKNIKPSPADDTPIINLIPNHLSKQEERQGFLLLFDGESLAGGMLPEGGWEIKEGALILKSVDRGESLKPNGLKLTKDKIGPFEFNFEFRTNDDEAVVGIHYTENDILEEEPIYGQLASKRLRDENQWNQGKIKVLPNNKVEYWLNGYKILEYYRDSDSSFSGHLVLNRQKSLFSYRSLKFRSLN